MERNDLHETLEHLHEEIEKAKFVGPADEALLRELMDDIRELLEAAAERRGEEHESIRERLKDAVEHFADSHPTLTSNIKRLADALGRAAV